MASKAIDELQAESFATDSEYAAHRPDGTQVVPLADAERIVGELEAEIERLCPKSILPSNTMQAQTCKHGTPFRYACDECLPDAPDGFSDICGREL